jgi:hypothetical protein
MAERRLDLSGFEPENPLKYLGWGEAELEECTTILGGALWDPLPHWHGDQRAEMVSRLSGMRAEIRGAVGVPYKGLRSIALVDWTAMRNAVALIKGGGQLPDPFVSLADLGTVIGAALFHDRIVIFGEIDEAKSALGLPDDVVRTIPLKGGKFADRTRAMLAAHFSWAFHQFAGATSSPVPPNWLSWLQEQWHLLLPETPFPKHTAEAFGGRVLSYTTSPQRHSWQDALFAQQPYMWGATTSHSDLILDNDLRALMYQRLASTLDAMLSETPGGSTTRYVGGCLRSPLILAWARKAEAELLAPQTATNWMQEQWRYMYHTESRPVRVPFWLQAVLASCRVKADFPQVLYDLRHAAEPYRNRRAELDDAVQKGDIKVLGSLFAALAGDLDRMTKSVDTITGGVVEASAAAAKVLAPVAPSEIITPIAKVVGTTQSDWVRRLSLRLFKPHLRLILDLSEKANKATNVLPHARELFDLPRLDSRQPQEFLDRLGSTSWIV